jgi:hypothetical protein
MAAVEKLRATEGGQAIIDSANVAAGLSLGEYTALAFAGAFRCVRVACAAVPRHPSFTPCCALHAPCANRVHVYSIHSKPSPEERPEESPTGVR